MRRSRSGTRSASCYAKRVVVVRASDVRRISEPASLVDQLHSLTHVQRSSRMLLAHSAANGNEAITAAAVRQERIETGRQQVKRAQDVGRSFDSALIEHCNGSSVRTASTRSSIHMDLTGVQLFSCRITAPYTLALLTPAPPHHSLGHWSPRGHISHRDYPRRRGNII